MSTMNVPRRWRRATLAAAALLLALAGCATLDEKQREWIFQPSDHSWGAARRPPKA